MQEKKPGLQDIGIFTNFYKKLNATKCLKGVTGPEHFGFKEGGIGQ